MCPDPKTCVNYKYCVNKNDFACPVDFYEYQSLHDKLCSRALALGDDSLTDKEQAFIYGVITEKQLLDQSFVL